MTGWGMAAPGDHAAAAPAQRSLGQSRAGTGEAPGGEGGRWLERMRSQVSPVAKPHVATDDELDEVWLTMVIQYIEC